MNSFSLIGTLFVSIAVIIAILGELVTLLDYFQIQRPNFEQPLIAFGGLLSIIFLLSAIVTTNIMQAGDSGIVANNIAELAVKFSFLPFFAAFVESFWLIKNWRPIKNWLGSVIMLTLGAAFYLFLYPFREFFYNINPTLPLIIALLFALVPIFFNYRPPPKRNV